MSKGYGARTEAETKAALATVAKAEKAGIRTVQLQFVDLHGITKSVQIPIHMMPNAIKHGTWFDGSSVEGFTRIAESDQMLRPDMDTWRTAPPGRARREARLQGEHGARARILPLRIRR